MRNIDAVVARIDTIIANPTRTLWSSLACR